MQPANRELRMGDISMADFAQTFANLTVNRRQEKMVGTEKLKKMISEYSKGNGLLQWIETIEFYFTRFDWEDNLVI